MDKDNLRARLQDLTPEDLRTLRAMINGKLGKHTLTPERARRMVEAREQKRKQKD